MSDGAFTWDEAKLEETREAAHAWVARFAPLIMEEKVLGVRALKDRLKTIEELETSGPSVLQRLQQVATDDDWKLLDTIEKSLGQLESLETSLRKQLGTLAPGDPMGIADLDRLADRLAERSARAELGIDHEPETPDVLELKTAPANYGTAIGAGVFGLGWTSFTAVHAVLMIGGLMQAFGWFALFLLLFYAIFFGVGFALLAAAFNAACDESILLDGRRLTIRRQMGAMRREKSFQVGSGSLAKIGKIQAMKSSQTKAGARVQAILLTGEDGKTISFAGGQTNERLRELVEQINAYLRLKG